MKNCLACDTYFDNKLDRGVFCSGLCRASFNQIIKNKCGGIIIKIYVLKDPHDFSIFYVGRTVMTLNFRLKGHIKEVNDGATSKKREVIKKILNNGAIPIIELIEEYVCYSIEDEINVNKKEIELLSKYISNGYSMCNFLGTKKSHIEHAIRPLLSKYFSKIKNLNSTKDTSKERHQKNTKKQENKMETEMLDSKKEVSDTVPVVNPKYDFTGEKFLVIEKYTKYPLAQKPTNPVEAKIWMGKKKVADQEIKDAWDSRII